MPWRMVTMTMNTPEIAVSNEKSIALIYSS